MLRQKDHERNAKLFHLVDAKQESENISSDKQDFRKHIYLYSQLNENTERNLFIDSEYFEGIVDDENAHSLTIRVLGSDRGIIIFDKAIKR